CVSGGSALPPTVAAEFERRFGVPIHQGYGVTETSPVLSVSDLRLPPIPTCSGTPIPDVELAVVDSSLQEVPIGTDGELAAAGPNVAWGYFRMPELTAQKFRELSLGGRPPKRYYLTGDIASLDEAGRVYIKGRMDDLIVVNGMNVYPAEIANVLAEFPGCMEVVVGRVASEKHGQEPVAVMVLAEGVRATEEEVRSFAARLLAPHKVPARVLFVEQILRNALQKPLVKDMLLSFGLPAC
ncbi:MAG: class I adenylate-forming enzyme family protein, partial [Armatimonadota bacterium]